MTAKLIHAGLQNGWIGKNDLRELLGLKRLPDDVVKVSLPERYLSDNTRIEAADLSNSRQWATLWTELHDEPTETPEDA